jgi:lipopolysaccharide export system protein LptA
MKKFIKLFLIILLLLKSNSALAQVNFSDVIQPQKGAPINIKSESLTIKNNENLAIFSKNVIVTQGEMNLTSNEVKLFTELDKSTSKTKFKTIEALGNVYFKSGDKKVRSEHANYDVKKGILVLAGNVKIEDEDTSLEGKIFRYNIITGKAEIKNSDSLEKTNDNNKTRVRAVFTPGQQMEEVKTPTDALQKFKGKNPE